MTNPGRGRLSLFVGILVSFAIGLHVFAPSLGVSPIALAPLYMFSPMVAGLVVCVRRGIPLRAVGIKLGRDPWLAVSAVTALPLVGLTLIIAISLPGVGFDSTVDVLPGIELPPGMPGVAATIGLMLGLGVTVNALFAFGEEVGWRGYLLWELAPWGFWRASIAIGIVWGLWHTPVIVAGYNYPSFPIVGIGMITLACLSFSPVYTYLVLRARSVLAAAFLHGVFNGSAGLVVAYAVADTVVLDELVASPVGAAGIVAFGLVTVGIAITGPPSLSRSFVGETTGTASV